VGASFACSPSRRCAPLTAAAHCFAAGAAEPVQSCATHSFTRLSTAFSLFNACSARYVIARSMTHFSKPAGISADGYIDKSPLGLSLLRVPERQTRDLALIGGTDSAGKPLWVSIQDRTKLSCPVGFTELSAVGKERRFRVTAVIAGATTVEARLAGPNGALLDSVRVEVPASVAVTRSGPNLGHDGEIPGPLRAKLRAAIDAAWKLNEDARFVETFRDVVTKLSGDPKPNSIYADSLNRTVIHLLDSSRDPRLKDGLAQERQDIKDRAVSGAAPSYSFRNEPNIWIRRSAFDKGTRQLTACIFHEVAHVAGARGDAIAEMALDKLHNSAGIPR
jgi:hypothetical protein